MNAAWPKVRLGEILTEWREIPNDDDLASGRVRIIEKISFDSGRIQLRVDGSTKTGMKLRLRVRLRLRAAADENGMTYARARYTCGPDHRRL